MKIIMNIKGAETPAEALTKVWCKDGASHSPQCATRTRIWGQHYQIRRAFDIKILEFSETVKGSRDIEIVWKKAEQFIKENNGKFSFSKRRGYMVLEFTP